jgi:putative transcriptional regulator
MQNESSRRREPDASWGRAMESLTGRLLVATPALRDPNFERTVVLLVAHEDGGALGVVLNRATEVPVSEVLGPGGSLAGEPSVVFEGGPVQPEAAICLARARPGVETLGGFNRVSGAIGTVDLSGDPDRLREGVLGVRVFAGYRGSWKTRSPVDRGSCSTRCPATRSPTGPMTSGRWCCGGRAVCSRRWRTSRPTRRRTEDAPGRFRYPM